MYGQALKSIDVDIHFEELYFLEKKARMTQRGLAQKLGISLEGVNYCLKALIDVAQIKAINFNKNPNKFVYLYLLPGLVEKVKFTLSLLRCKHKEYKFSKEEIESIQSSLKNLQNMSGSSR